MIQAPPTQPAHAARAPERPVLERCVLLLAAWAIVCLYLIVADAGALSTRLGDPDDALRLVMVRELAHGRGWYDQIIWRVQPPRGFWLHWSRLLDGALATMLGALRLVVGDARAEWWMRLLWPLCLIGPAIAAGLTLTERLNDAVTRRAAVLAAAVICALSLPLYAQFHPGRVDHHNVQILCWLIAFAAACDDGPSLRSPIVAGAATGLGLAIGFEASVFLVAIMGFMGLRFVTDRAEAPRLRAYGLSLCATMVVAFLAQTPPARWGVSACDGLALNVVAGLGIGALGLTLTTLRARGGTIERLALVGAAGLASIAVCLALDPSCMHGPLGEVDRRIYPIWLSHVQELLPLPRLLHTDLPTALTLLCAMVVGPIAWIALGFMTRNRARPAYWLNGAMIVLSAAMAFAMLRMGSYLMWATLPSVATLAALVVQRLGTARFDPARITLAAALMAPSVVAAAPIAAMRLAAHPTASIASAPDRCIAGPAYAELARLRPGLVATTTDLGPYILAYTRSTTLAAPDHRAGFGIVSAYNLLAAPASGPGAGDGAARALGVTYVVVCPGWDSQVDGPRFAADSLEKVLDAGHPPAWLKRLSTADSALQIFAVDPTPLGAGPQ